MLELELIEREMLWNSVVLPKDARAAHDECISIFLASDRYLNRVVAVRYGIDDGLIDRDRGILGLIGKAASRIAPQKGLEEGRLAHESPEIPDLLADRSSKYLI